MERPISSASFSEAILDPSPERLIAVGRLILAAFSLVAVWFDPSQPATHAQLTYGILLLYLSYSALLGIASLFLVPVFAVEVVVHAIDITVFAVLMVLTEGPTSPFFAFFVFALFAATVRWNWQGTLATAFVLVLLFIFIGVFQLPATGGETDLNRPIIRGGYLVVAAMLLSYLGYVRERGRHRLAQLADWPAPPLAESDHPPIQDVLSHALNVVGARQALVIWEVEGEPYLYRASSAHGECTFRRDPPTSGDPPVAPAYASEPVLVLDADSGYCRLRRGRHIGHGRPLSRELVSEFRIRRAALAPVSGEGFAGNLLLIEPSRLGEDLLVLTEIVAKHVASEFQRHLMHQELLEAAAIRQRTRLARDLHDSILQTLTAAALQIKLALREAPPELQDRLRPLKRLISDQQRSLRAFVEDVRAPGSQAEPVRLNEEIGRALTEIARQWGCVAELEVEPAGSTVSAFLGSEVALMLRESVANSVRHGGASEVLVRISESTVGLQITVRDDGCGLAKSDGITAAPESAREFLPRSLTERVADLGGEIQFTSSDDGVTVRIAIPFR